MLTRLVNIWIIIVFNGVNINIKIFYWLSAANHFTFSFTLKGGKELYWVTLKFNILYIYFNTYITDANFITHLHPTAIIFYI